MVRTANYSDTTAILALMDEGYNRSKYREFSIDRLEAQKIINGAIQRTEVKGEGGTCVFLWEEDNKVQGIIIGVIDRIYHVAKELMATDLFFYVSKDLSSPRAFRSLMRAFEKWAWENPKVKKIDLGATDIIGDYNKVSVFYKRLGYNQSGVIFEKFRAEKF